MDLVILADHRIDVRVNRRMQVIDDDAELFQLRNKQLVVTDDIGILVVRIVLRYRRDRCKNDGAVTLLQDLGYTGSLLVPQNPALRGMYEKMGYHNNGIANSTWGGEQWFEMSYVLNM